ncbi:MAG: zinc ribbon domain-containing protein [Chloroflexi bacterium]|nr:zinc ribbon domain-containing protein [Chloroflexota bacterium]
MPIYEYCCPACRAKFELFRSLSQADAEARCPRCQSVAQKQFSAFASFSRNAEGVSTAVAGTGGGCSGCAASSCATCH